MKLTKTDCHEHKHHYVVIDLHLEEGPRAVYKGDSSTQAFHEYDKIRTGATIQCRTMEGTVDFMCWQKVK